MKMGFLKKLALKTTLDKAKSLYKKGNTVEEIVEKLWNNKQVAIGLSALGALDVSPEDLVEMIEDKVKKIKEGEQK